MIDQPLLVAEIDELDAGPRHQQIILGRLAAITAMMEPEHIRVGRKLRLDLAGSRVATGEDAGSAGRLAAPHQAASDQHILGRLIARRRVVGVPKDFAGPCRKGGQLVCRRFAANRFRTTAALAGKQDDVVIDQQGGHVHRPQFPLPIDGVRAPTRRARLPVERHDALAIVKKDTVAADRQGPWQDSLPDRPQDSACGRVQRHDLPRLLVVKRLANGS